MKSNLDFLTLERFSENAFTMNLLRRHLLQLAVTGVLHPVDDWDERKLEELSSQPIIDGDWIESKDQDPNGDIRLLQLADIGEGFFKNKSQRFVNNETFKSLNCTLLEKDDVLIARLPDPIGRACVFPELNQKCITVVDVAIVKVKKEVILPEYLVMLMNSPKMNRKIIDNSAGTTRQRVATGKLKKMTVVFPSELESQKKIITKYQELKEIVEKLDLQRQKRAEMAVLARNSTVAAISTAQTSDELQIAWERIQNNWNVITGHPEAIDLIKTLILDLAVRGDLLTSNKSKVAEIIKWTSSELKLDDSKLWNLPTLLKEKKEGWNRIPLAKLGSWGSGGTPTSSRKDYYQNGDIPWAVIGDLNNDIMTRTEASITEKALAESSTKLVPKGSILIAMYGASIGKTAITGIECCTNQAIAHCIVDTNIVSKEYFFIVAKSLKRHLIQEGKGAAQPNISQSVLKHLIIDLPPLDEQEKIVERVEALMQLCYRLKHSLRHSEDLAEKFSRSVVSASA
jgi:type I restriction enzyme S subunit